MLQTIPLQSWLWSITMCVEPTQSAAAASSRRRFGLHRRPRQRLTHTPRLLVDRWYRNCFGKFVSHSPHPPSIPLLFRLTSPRPVHSVNQSCGRVRRVRYNSVYLGSNRPPPSEALFTSPVNYSDFIFFFQANPPRCLKPGFHSNAIACVGNFHATNASASQ